MSRRKIYAAALACLFVLFLFAEAGAFLLSVELSGSNFLNVSQNVIKQFDTLIDDVTVERLNRMVYENWYLNSNPSVAALIDENGTVIAKNGEAFVVDIESENGYDTVVVSIEKYLTEDLEREIKACQKDSKKNGKIFINKFTFCKNGEEYIPVEAEISNFGSPEKTHTLKFTDYTPTVETDKIKAQAWGFYDEEDKKFKKNRDKLEKQFEVFLEGFSESHSSPNAYSGGGGSLDGNGEMNYEMNFPIDGRNYCLYFAMRRDTVYDAFTSDAFKTVTFFMGILFVIFGAVMHAVITRLYNKNEQLKKSRQAFISAAAHELKTPVAVISNSCECILENVEPEKNTEYVNSIYDESKRMSKMIKTLLQYNRCIGSESIEKTAVDFSEIIKKETEKYLPLAEAKRLDFSCDFSEKILLECSKELIGMAVDNFLSNAVKFAPENGTVKVTAGENRGRIFFRVYNSGSGISAADAPHIWEELYSGSESRSRDENATGMGLAVSRVILELHGFSYGFKNADGGVTFFFEEK